MEEGADPDGDIERDTGQELGFEAFETEVCGREIHCCHIFQS